MSTLTALLLPQEDDLPMVRLEGITRAVIYPHRLTLSVGDRVLHDLPTQGELGVIGYDGVDYDVVTLLAEQGTQLNTSATVDVDGTPLPTVTGLRFVFGQWAALTHRLNHHTLLPKGDEPVVVTTSRRKEGVTP